MRQKIIFKVKVLKSFWEKSKGLIGEKTPKRILINTRFGIHTFGIRFPIDVVVLDGSFYVKAIKKSLMPNRMFFWKPLYDKVLELPEGEVEKLGIKVEQKIAISA